MDRFKVLEERLREEACKGDFEAVIEIISTGVNINATNAINGWTALHWAAKRGHKEIVRALLERGADPLTMSDKGETPLCVASNPEVRLLLGGEALNGTSPESTLPITPNYLKNPPLPSSASNGCPLRTSTIDSYHSLQTDELVLKVKVANSGDPDFIEIELNRSELTYYSLLRVCCDELGIPASQVSRIRKLPDTMIRKDKDVQRLSPMQELEIVLTSGKHQSNDFT